MILRAIFGLILLLLVFLMPWWISFILALIGLFYFKNLYEVILVGLILDSIHNTPFTLWGFEFVFTIFFIVAMYLIVKFRKTLLI